MHEAGRILCGLALVGAGCVVLGCTDTKTDTRVAMLRAGLRRGEREDSDRGRHVPHLKPIAQCVEHRAGGELYAHFGYENKSTSPASIPIGRFNAFRPGSIAAGQPTIFLPGRHGDAVRAALGEHDSIVWSLGPNGARASRHSPQCASAAVCGDGQIGCRTDVYGSVQCEQCDDGNALSGDGCSKTCTVEPDWACAESGQACHRAACGDGYADWWTDRNGVAHSEQCDDGNLLAGDGCGPTCVVEAGWFCPESGCVRPVCGNRALECTSDGTGDTCEVCDDGNYQPSDGCSDSCTVEEGWACTESGQACHPLACGDGYVDCGTGADGNTYCEECDDRNTRADDGCSASCGVEPGWVCPEEGERCRSLRCGDGHVDCGMVADGDWYCEECDDRNTRADDGCSASCAVEPGWVCPEEERRCRRARCGDGYVDCWIDADGNGYCEACDDSDAKGDDGCSASCAVEPGWVCPNAGFPCRSVACGDGYLDCWNDETGAEHCEGCDDGNAQGGDGCSPGCAVESDWVCNAPGQPCLTLCGNGSIDAWSTGSEACDDGNAQAGDGCSGSCAVEPGWVCPNAGYACRNVACGDGYLDCWNDETGAEHCEGCDDGNAQAGDGCSATCAVEADWVCDIPGQPCHPLCGNGSIDVRSTGVEACDDGNAQAGDGCTGNCAVEPGWVCPWPGQPCRQVVCGDGYRDSYTDVDGVTHTEVCDGSNLGGATCDSTTNGLQSFGNLACTSSCALDTSGCVAPPACLRPSYSMTGSGQSCTWRRSLDGVMCLPEQLGCQPITSATVDLLYSGGQWQIRFNGAGGTLFPVVLPLQRSADTFFAETPVPLPSNALEFVRFETMCQGETTVTATIWADNTPIPQRISMCYWLYGSFHGSAS